MKSVRYLCVFFVGKQYEILALERRCSERKDGKKDINTAIAT